VTITHIAVLRAALLVLFWPACVVVALAGIDELPARQAGRPRRAGPAGQARLLRRLDRRRRTGPTVGSRRWLADVVRAHGHRLRVEAEPRSAGLPLRSRS
jgi:hypothetical protein